MARRVAFAALLVNAALCAGWAERVDTFITSTAILTAALIVAVAVAPLPTAGATSPRESCGFQRGAAAACAKAQRRQCVMKREDEHGKADHHGRGHAGGDHQTGHQKLWRVWQNGTPSDAQRRGTPWKGRT